MNIFFFFFLFISLLVTHPHSLGYTTFCHCVKSHPLYLPHGTNKCHCLNVYLMFDNVLFFFSWIRTLFCRWSTGVFSCWLIFNSHTFVCFSFQLKKKHASYTLCSFLFTSDRLLTGLLTARFFFSPPQLLILLVPRLREVSIFFSFFFF